MEVEGGALHSETQESLDDKELPPTAAAVSVRPWLNEIFIDEN
jgi:hypothetical protein